MKTSALKGHESAMMNKKTVSLCMIVKNEDWILDRCLDSVTGIVDEIIIGDTGSTDNSKEIAAKYKAQVFDIPWEDDFSRARNMTLKKAACDWILLLDADELFDKRDTEAFLQLLDNEKYDGYHFTLLNYFDEENTKEYSVHYAFRLLRNTGEYYYQGRIHEQINKKGSPLDGSRFTLADVTLFHYGYTEKAIERKQKHARNMPLLKKQLEDNPADPYFLFNIANEYMALGDINKALEVYLKSYEKRAVTQAYFPHIFYRIVLCYITLKDYGNALSFVTEGLAYYPECTDFEYLRGCIYQKSHRHLLAIASFKRCLTMGEAPNRLKFTGGCGTYKACISLGDIYEEEEVYSNAVNCYVNALEYREAPGCTLSLGRALSHLYADGHQLFDQLILKLPYSDHDEKQLHAINILIETKLAQTAESILEKSNLIQKWKGDYLFLSGKLSFYLHNYKKALSAFSALYEDKLSLSILSCYKDEAPSYYFLSLILNDLLYSDKLTSLIDTLTAGRKNTCLLIASLLLPDAFPEENTSVFDYHLFFMLFEILLKSGQKDAADRLLPAIPKLFILDSYTKLGEIYARQGYPVEAAASILQSVKEYNYIDKDSAWWLSSCL
ncbi:glycosyltransferase [Anaerocolumna jejuensis]|uniref:glycosyltransferase family 2 protein n=1 Tax=Anaerocolumna jejuensis TaxID=259063 RepID=UPI003F7BBD2D